jgi:hypothetical protein
MTFYIGKSHFISPNIGKSHLYIPQYWQISFMSPLILANVIYVSPNIGKSHLCIPLYCQVIYVYPISANVIYAWGDINDVCQY